MRFSLVQLRPGYQVLDIMGDATPVDLGWDNGKPVLRCVIAGSATRTQFGVTLLTQSDHFQLPDDRDPEPDWVNGEWILYRGKVEIL